MESSKAKRFDEKTVQFISQAKVNRDERKYQRKLQGGWSLFPNEGSYRGRLAIDDYESNRY